MVHRSREKRPFRERNGREHPPPSPEVLAKTTPTTGFPEGVGGPENRGHLRRWRRGRDLNPRYGCPYAAFRVRCDRPLCHLSGSRTGAAYLEQSAKKSTPPDL